MINSTSPSSGMSITPTVYVIINIISLSTTILGTCLSCVILTTLLIRKKTFRSVPLLLCTNNYILVFFLGVFEFMHNVDTLRGDLGLVKNDEEIIRRCRIQAYIVFSLLSAVYLACVLQASENVLQSNRSFFPIFRLSFDFAVSCIRLFYGYLILRHI